MIHELSKQDNKWREIAFKICKNKMLADDLVNEMYLKLFDCKKQINDFYVIITIRNLFYDYVKQDNKKVDLDLFYDFEADNYKFELDDREIEILNSLTWLEKGYLELSFDLSLREIGKELNTNYGFVYKVIKKAKDKIKK